MYVFTFLQHSSADLLANHKAEGLKSIVEK
jgi:hypothetical protein